MFFQRSNVFSDSAGVYDALISAELTYAPAIPPTCLFFCIMPTIPRYIISNKLLSHTALGGKLTRNNPCCMPFLFLSFYQTSSS